MFLKAVTKSSAENRGADQVRKHSIRRYEEGVDAGGVTRERFQIFAWQMFNPDYTLFRPEHLSFKLVGRVIGKAIYDGRLLDAYFARSLYRQILGEPADYRNVEWVDPEYYKSLLDFGQ